MHAARAILVCAVIMAAFNYSIARPITDGFHEGEYLGTLWAMRSYLSGATSFPLLVHGPMDFLPALIASAISGDQSIIVLTRAINTLIAGVTWVLFLDALLILLRRNEYRFAAGIMSGLLFLGMVVIIPADAVERQQAFLAIRDVFLVGALWLTLRGLTGRSPFVRYALMVLGGAAVSASLYWAYDRFLAAIAFGGMLVLVLLLQRGWKLAAAFVLGTVAGLYLIPHIVPTGSLAENAGNLAYWLKFSGEVWHLPYLVRIPAIPTAIAMIVLLLVFAKAWIQERARWHEDFTLAFIAGLLALQGFFLLKYFNLPRHPNNYYFVWPFVLLLGGLTLHWPVSGKIDNALRSLWAEIRAGGVRRQLGLAVITLSLGAIVTNNMAFASVMNLRAMIRPPADAELLPQGVTAAIRDLAIPDGECILLWSNEGVFATALRRPFCTRYMYPVYASANHEAELLRQLENTPPAIVIFDSPFWSMNIYGRTMQQRLPATDRYLRAHYQFSVRDGYTVGIRRGDGANTSEVEG